MPTPNENLLGTFLKDRRGRLDPTKFGFDGSRRRTPGLRREEVAQRAHVSAIWYTWLEQGRQANPSADVLDRLADALQLTAPEREHLFLIAQGRPPEVRYEPCVHVTAGLQRMIDSLEFSPALVKNSAWDIVAWNRAATMVLTDYGALAPEQRNILRLLFNDPLVRSRSPHWDSQTRHVVATFRLEVSRSGASDKARALVEEMSQSSAEFAAMWRENDVDTYGEGIKRIEHLIAGSLSLEYSSFAVDGQSDLSLLVYTPATPEDLGRVRALIAS
jgi:transcriptional regulator with XRE-family HTH domain